jgi:tRNA(Ile)-lysidine synthase TilS/MesJ
VRVRQEVLPVLERELGPGVAEALARTADQLREDDDALEHFAAEMVEEIADHAEAGISLEVASLLARRPPCGTASSAWPRARSSRRTSPARTSWRSRGS